MSALVEALRIASLAAFAAPLLLRVIGPVRGAKIRTHQGAGVPVLANVAAFLMFFAALGLFRGSTQNEAALPLAVAGCFLAVAGAVVIVRSRLELGAAWSLVPKADEATGLVTSGPYRLVRHPIYLGFVLLTAGQAIAFASWPALILMLLGIVPSFVWRAIVEERLLAHIFGERYALYRRQSRMIVPYLL